MYPKVKVRTEGQDDQHAHAAHEYNWNSLLSLKDIQFLLLQDSYFPVKEFRDVSPSSTARIPKPSLPNIILQTESASEDKKSNFDEEDRPNIRAGSVLRPRAVLSSPDNDTMIGNKNSVKAPRPSALKNHHSVQSRHAQCKVASSQAVDDSRLNTRKSKDTTDTNLKGKKWSTTAISSRRRNITTDKPRSVRIS
ncbi:hypothetical protein MANES_15G045800v8 [Manihot esculenta]|uniref:Uncharacterized protein n=1 Tax=Manihot esculenta TaxID=3983 RepID=A0ACB7G982_MANES|nr:hypothetical protein MANES_15G045800v8 [Manihot esculenta]